jgi:hypothetical protein
VSLKTIVEKEQKKIGKICFHHPSTISNQPFFWLIIILSRRVRVSLSFKKTTNKIFYLRNLVHSTTAREAAAAAASKHQARAGEKSVFNDHQ